MQSSFAPQTCPNYPTSLPVRTRAGAHGGQEVNPTSALQVSFAQSFPFDHALSLSKQIRYHRRVTVRITEAELARDIHAVLAKVREGVEVIVEQDHRPVAVIKTPPAPGRKISECIALGKAYEQKLGYAPVPDPDFARDVQAAVEAHSEPLNPAAWD